MDKERLDVRLVREGKAPSREKARALIKNGQAFVDGKQETKPGAAVREEQEVEIRGEVLKYVSRGGLKLEKAIEAFGLDLTGAVCIDAGASTGGFTDCMMQHGASKVYAVDVGTAQLDPGLKADPRVVSLEQTNIRYISKEDVPELCDLATFDLSFISLEKTVPPVAERLKEDGRMICLIKPQFEAGPSLVGKRGVVKDPKVHEAVLRRIYAWSKEQGYGFLGITWSPIRGPEGNIEYLICLSKNEEEQAEVPLWPQFVRRSHEAF